MARCDAVEVGVERLFCQLLMTRVECTRRSCYMCFFLFMLSRFVVANCVSFSVMCDGCRDDLSPSTSLPVLSCAV